jgi:antitoxin MazE
MIDLSVVDGKFILTPVSESEYTLNQLLADVTDENLHSEVNTGNAVGGESW